MLQGRNCSSWNPHVPFPAPKGNGLLNLLPPDSLFVLGTQGTAILVVIIIPLSLCKRSGRAPLLKAVTGGAGGKPASRPRENSSRATGLNHESMAVSCHPCRRPEGAGPCLPEDVLASTVARNSANAGTPAAGL